MNRLILALLLVLFLPLPLFAEDEAEAAREAARASAEEAYFRAYYFEFGKRNLKAARKAYQEFIWDFEDVRDLYVRAHLGMIRIAARTGDGETEELLAEVKRALADPDGAFEGPVLQALQAELMEARAILSRSAGPDPVEARIKAWLPALALGPGSSRCLEAEDALVGYGSKAIPALIEVLRSSDPLAVGGATRVLLKLRGTEPVRVLTEALRDMDVGFPLQITMQLRDAEVGQHPIFIAAFEHPEPEVREAAVVTASQWINENNMDAPMLWDLILEATGDYSGTVQLAAIAAIDGNAGTARRLAVAAAGSQSTNPQIRSLAIRALFGWPLEAEEVTEDLYEPVLTLLHCGVVRAEILATSLALEVGGKLANSAILQLLDSGRPLAMLRAAEAIQDFRVDVGEDIIRALVLAATNAFAGDRDEPWKMTYDAMFDALAAHPKEVRRVGLASFMPLLSAVNASPTGMRREYAMNQLLTLLMTCTEKKEPSQLLLDAWYKLSRDADRATWLKAFGDRMGPRVYTIASDLRQIEDDDLRLQAVSLLARILPPGNRSQLYASLQDSDPRIRYTVLNAVAGELDREDLAEAARAGIRDEDELVRRASVAPLVKALGKDSLIWLLDGVKADPDLTNLAVKAVKDHLSAEDTREFVRLVLADVEEIENQAIILAVAGSALSDEMIVKALKTEDPAMIHWIAPIAGERYLLEAWPLLLPFKDQDMGAAAALERIRSYHLGLREYESLKSVGAGETLAKAREMAASDDPTHRRAAALALGALRDPAGISILLDLVKDENDAVRQAALTSLSRLAGEEE